MKKLMPLLTGGLLLAAVQLSAQTSAAKPVIMTTDGEEIRAERFIQCGKPCGIVAVAVCLDDTADLCFRPDGLPDLLIIPCCMVEIDLRPCSFPYALHPASGSFLNTYTSIIAQSVGFVKRSYAGYS